MRKNMIKTSVGMRLIIIAALTLVLLIPAVMIQTLIHERQQRRDSAIQEVSDKWGNTQTLSGPILSVPFKVHSKTDKGELITTVKYAHFLPEDLNISGSIRPEIRYRGIYEVVLYNATLKLAGSFSFPDFRDLNIPGKDILWKDSFAAIGITDMKGIKDFITVRWNSHELPAHPGIESNDVLASGIRVKTPLSPEIGKFEFSADINLNGSTGLMFTPIGKETKIEVSSDWANPSFTGYFLPESREVTADGFTAKWKVLHLNRNYPQAWLGSKHQIEASAFGVKLLLAVDEYQKTMRTAKYAVMFISLTFLSFFMIELLNRKVLHPIQYLLIGFALLVFYTLLLSFSEHIVFKYAYLIASAGILSLITAYTKSVLSSTLQTAIIGGILILLYGYLYIVLQLQDYALLMGSLGLFVVLATIMYLTRRIDWFSVMKHGGGAEKAPK
ncbi:MAG: cell envelope integrity protein CreD [bacterium]